MEKVMLWFLFVLFVLMYIWVASPVASEALGAW
jgi:hypothetical protein